MIEGGHPSEQSTPARTGRCPAIPWKRLGECVFDMRNLAFLFSNSPIYGKIPMIKLFYRFISLHRMSEEGRWPLNAENLFCFFVCFGCFMCNPRFYVR